MERYSYKINCIIVLCRRVCVFFFYTLNTLFSLSLSLSVFSPSSVYYIFIFITYFY